MKRYVLVEFDDNGSHTDHPSLWDLADELDPGMVRTADVTEVVCQSYDDRVFLVENGWGEGEPFYPDWS